ncbi:T9SS type A sorting domain-containing protein [Elusimicrobiota bacterium]
MSRIKGNLINERFLKVLASGAGFAFGRKRLLSYSILFLFTGVSFALIIGGGYIVEFARLVGSGGQRLASSNYVLNGAGIESIGGLSMAGGVYSIDTSQSTGVAKLEADLTIAHCYPNPYKPNSGLGHNKITFSHTTAYTKLMVFNIAGELVYSTEADTPTGELEWNVRNNAGEKVASGVYLYLLTDNEGHKKVGKFAILR